MKLLPSDPDIQTIVGRIGSGDLDLQPNFQRGEVWTTSKKKKLIDSVLRDWHVPPSVGIGRGHALSHHRLPHAGPFTALALHHLITLLQQAFALAILALRPLLDVR